MVLKKKKVSTRRQRVRENMSADRFANLVKFANSSLPVAILILSGFIAAIITLFALYTTDGFFKQIWKPYYEIIALGVVVILVCTGLALYIRHYEERILSRPTRMFALSGLFLLLLVFTKSVEASKDTYLTVGSAVTCAIILTIAYNQRLAFGLSMFYSTLACFALNTSFSFELFLIMLVGVGICCFSLREIRTRMKLIEVTIVASVGVFITAASMGIIQEYERIDIFENAGWSAVATIAVGVVIQGFLPIIEKIFGIATSMTLMDYSDANQPLLKKLAMDAPGTFSHSLLIGSIAEAAAEAIGANGLLCRVGAYYHDIGKVNKPRYFGENQMGSASRHDQLSPAMSQLVIVGHVKDGIEIAKEFGLPSVLRQFIETHHGTTLIEYFYNEAKKKQDDKQSPVSETEFRYPGPKPRTKEAAIVMLSDTIESAVRSMTELSPTRIEVIVHNMVMKRLQDGQFDECDLTLKELSKIEGAITKSLAAHHHGRIAYPQAPDKPAETTDQSSQSTRKN